MATSDDQRDLSMNCWIDLETAAMSVLSHVLRRRTFLQREGLLGTFRPYEHDVAAKPLWKPPRKKRARRA